ncbi:MAG: aspartate aminotransferase family protein [Rhizobiaceae bacterium]|nr:aspartate aminotransferase family protein [Rhizobiaceae bacterium]
MINGFDPGQTAGLSADELRLISERSEVLGPSYKLFYRHPAHFVRAEGVWMYDAAGNAYLDVYNNVPCVGHCHPRVVEAISRQSAILNTHTRYLDESIIRYSKDLLSTFPSHLGNVMYTCTGSEAVDLALRISRYFTGGQGFIVTENAYHGLTTAVSELSPSMGKNVPLGQSVYTVPAPDRYRTAPGEDVSARFAADVQAAIDAMQRKGIKLAGMIADMVLSSDGILTEPKGMFAAAVKAVQAAGGLFIADEVQPGFARTGDSMWGFQRHGIAPDLVVMGKPMGNGMPIAGVVMRPDLIAEFGTKIRYFNTFGANTVCIAAAQTVLDVIRDEQLLGNCANVGAYMRAGLDRLAADNPRVGEVRSAGLFLGMDFVKDRRTKEPDGAYAIDVVNRLREKQVLISASGVSGNVLKIRPPLPFSRANADEFLSRLEETLRELG